LTVAEFASTRRTLEELKTTYLLHPGLRDVLVEGRHDRAFIRNFLDQEAAGIDDNSVVVYAVQDRVYLDADSVIGRGFEDGNRGRLLASAMIAEDWDHDSRRGVTFVIDADRSHFDESLPEFETLLITDYGSLECYAFSSGTLSRFVQVVLRRDSPTGEDLHAIVEPVLVEIGCARVVVHEAGLGFGIDDEVVRRWRSRDGDLGGELLVRKVCRGKQLTKEQVDVLCRNFHATLGKVEGEPRKFIRGHDIAPVLVNKLGLKNSWADPAVVESALMGCIDRAELSGEQLFVNLLSRVAA
jgi:hypothetical protein